MNKKITIQINKILETKQLIISQMSIPDFDETSWGYPIFDALFDEPKTFFEDRLRFKTKFGKF